MNVRDMCSVHTQLPYVNGSLQVHPWCVHCTEVITHDGVCAVRF